MSSSILANTRQRFSRFLQTGLMLAVVAACALVVPSPLSAAANAKSTTKSNSGKSLVQAAKSALGGNSGYRGGSNNDDRDDRDRDPRGREGNHDHIHHDWNGVGHGHPNHNGHGYGHYNCDHDEGGGEEEPEPPVLVPVTIVNTSGVLLIGAHGGTVALTAELLTGSAPVTYQWMKRNTLGAYSMIPGATSLTLDLTNVDESDNGLYWIVATNALGSVASTETQVVVATDLTVLNTTGDQIFFEPGDTVTLTAELISGTQPVSYQWMMRNGAGPSVAIPGATTLNYTIASAQDADAGQYWLVATNASGSVTTSQTQVIVAGIPHE